MGIAYGNILFFHRISEGRVYKKISTREYNNSKFYEWFNNPFTANYGSLALNLLPINIDDRTSQNKRAHYTPDMLPAAISVAPYNYVITLTAPSNFTKIHLLTYDDPNHHPPMNKYES